MATSVSMCAGTCLCVCLFTHIYVQMQAVNTFDRFILRLPMLFLGVEHIIDVSTLVSMRVPKCTPHLASMAVIIIRGLLYSQFFQYRQVGSCFQTRFEGLGFVLHGVVVQSHPSNFRKLVRVDPFPTVFFAIFCGYKLLAVLAGL